MQWNTKVTIIEIYKNWTNGNSAVIYLEETPEQMDKSIFIYENGKCMLHFSPRRPQL